MTPPVTTTTTTTRRGAPPRFADRACASQTPRTLRGDGAVCEERAQPGDALFSAEAT